MRRCFFLIFFLSCLQAIAQTEKEKLIGDWKFYLTDNINFEFLRLNADGTGLKCFGRTIEGRDTLYMSHIPTLSITEWKSDNKKLYIESNNKLIFKINPEYQIHFFDNGSLEIKGEHLLFNLYPSPLNRTEFQRSVNYQRSDKIPKVYGATAVPCIVEDKMLFTFKTIDSSTHVAEYKRSGDLVPFIVACNNGFQYAAKYNDHPYTIQLPSSIKHWSFGFGNKMYYISFNSDNDEKNETSVVIYYDFDDDMKNRYFSKLAEGSEKKDIVRRNGMDIYRTTNWQGKFEGKIFLKNSIVIAYYTIHEKLEQKLQDCITSFQYK